MSLGFYDEEIAVLTVERFSVDGRLGGPQESVVFLRNDDPAVYYTDVTATVQMEESDVWGEFAETGWSIKLIYGDRQPTETEWDQVASSNVLEMPDIGEEAAADTDSYFPIWIRLFVPGNIPAQRKTNLKITVTATDRLVA